MPARRICSPARAAVLASCAAALGLAAAGGGEAGAVQVGVYQDRPATTVPRTARQVGPRATRVVSVYVTAGDLIPGNVVALANSRNATLMVNWMADSGRAGARQPRFRLVRVIRGRHDAGLRRLGRQMRGLKRPPIFRPMPEMNTNWYPWSGTVNRNRPTQYAKAFTRVRRVIKGAGGRRVKVMWAPYHRSIPEREGNEIEDYFPGVRHVDLVGASGYNFGRKGGLAWTDPDPLFADAYRRVTALAPKPFWIAETGSTGAGGNKAKWISSLRDLPDAFPLLAGIVWYDVRDRNGDFRIQQTRRTTRAFRVMTARVA